MSRGNSKATVRQIQTLFTLGAAGAMTDAQLLERFTSTRDEASFANLVERHGPMVLGICRRILIDPHDADDAFQATFLVLVRKAASILRGELVGNWLYGVAYRTAREAKVRAIRRRVKEGRVIDVPRTEPSASDQSRDLLESLDDELSRLAEKYRIPVVLCDLEGRSRAEVARVLGVPEGTLSSRLARARELLRDRLTRRGASVSTGTMAAVLSRDAASATVPAALAETTIRAAIVVAAGSTTAVAASAPVAALTEGVLKIMLLTKLKIAGVAGLILGVAVASASVLAQQPASDSRPSADAERLRSVEEKLDRVLEALGRAASTPTTTTGTSNTPNPAAIQAVQRRSNFTQNIPYGGEHTVSTPANQQRPDTVSPRPDLPRNYATMNDYTVAREPNSESGRIKALEIRMDRLEQTVGDIIKRLESKNEPAANNPLAK
jgi:RNA polymerase sigma factor (sigma-70 family)